MAAKKFQFADVDAFVGDVLRISDTLSNLNYLIEVDAEEPDLVRRYTKQAGQMLRALENMVRAADGEMCLSPGY